MVAGMRETKASNAWPPPMTGNDRGPLRSRRYHYRSGGADKLIVALRDGEGSGSCGPPWKAAPGPGRRLLGYSWILGIGGVLPRALGPSRAMGGDGAAAMWLNVGGGNVCALGLYRSQGYAMETMHLSKRL